MPTIAANIKKLLQAQKPKMTQSSLAREMQLSRQHINNWIRGRNLPTHEQQLELCKIFKVDMNTLTGVKEIVIGDQKDQLIAKQAEEIAALRKILKDLL